MTNCTYEQLYIMYNLSSKTIFKIKKELRDVYKKYCDKRPILPGKEVQGEETVLSRRGTIRTPTTIDDEKPRIVWFFGAIDVIKVIFFPKKSDKLKGRTFD
ncbi:hypothetical protein DMUE_5169 [Dictyocoela muelleri]|nr:hypothetical protein DMUE_5169 [Dictyocoela muelleri]